MNTTNLSTYVLVTFNTAINITVATLCIISFAFRLNINYLVLLDIVLAVAHILIMALSVMIAKSTTKKDMIIARLLINLVAYIAILVLAINVYFDLFLATLCVIIALLVTEIIFIIMVIFDLGRNNNSTIVHTPGSAGIDIEAVVAGT
jgi:hypothetical protein